VVTLLTAVQVQIATLRDEAASVVAHQGADPLRVVEDVNFPNAEETTFKGITTDGITMLRPEGMIVMAIKAIATKAIMGMRLHPDSGRVAMLEIKAIRMDEIRDSRRRGMSLMVSFTVFLSV
jgi:hypothetical protein